MAVPSSSTKWPPLREEELVSSYDSSKTVASASIGVSTWLIIGGIAYSEQEFQDSTVGTLLLEACFMLQCVMTLVTLTAIDVGWKYKGKLMLAAGAVGLGIATAWSVSTSNPVGARALFWSLSGMYLGWLLEICTGIFAALSGLVDRAGPEPGMVHFTDEGGVELRVDTLSNPIPVVPPPNRRRSQHSGNGSRE